MKLKLFSLLFFFSIFNVYSQYTQLTPEAEISVLTIGAGNSLNDAFGHNAYRIKDTDLDIVFNYGVYDFEAPYFIIKFAQGKLNYKIDANYYTDFERAYKRQNRTIQEQVLNLTLEEKQEIFNYLSNNYEPENQFYLYDFFYDNCATKIRDVLNNALTDNVVFNNPKNFEEKTFRTLIQDNLEWNSWGSFGIDVALGSVIDKPATASEYMFLPEYIHTFFANATINGDSKKNLIISSNTIYSKLETPESKNFFTSPLLILSIISILMLYITFKDYKNEKRSKWLDVLIFSITGLIGVFLLLLWFATDHGATAENYNLLWAFAINLFVVKQVLKPAPKSWFIRYLKFLIIMLCLLSFHWVVGIQRFPFALIPILIALLIRYVYLVKYFSKTKI